MLIISNRSICFIYRKKFFAYTLGLFKTIIINDNWHSSHRVASDPAQPAGPSSRYNVAMNCHRPTSLSRIIAQLFERKCSRDRYTLPKRMSIMHVIKRPRKILHYARRTRVYNINIMSDWLFYLITFRSESASLVFFSFLLFSVASGSQSV